MPRSSTECSTSSLPTARCRRSLDRRNVTVEPPRDPAHGDLATNAAMVLAKAAGTNPRALAEAIKPKLEALPPVTSVEIAGPGFINLRLTPDAWRDELSHDPSRRRRIRPLDRRPERAGQRRICVGQPDRPTAHGPLPRRGGRRQPRAPARGRGFPGHQGILCQRCRSAGRYARPVTAHALPREARRRHRRDSGGSLPRRLSEAGRRHPRRRIWRSLCDGARGRMARRCSGMPRSRRCST